MPRNETVEMDLTLTLNATATVIYGPKGLVTDVFLTEEASIERVYLDGNEVDGVGGRYTNVKPSGPVSVAIMEMLNDQIVSERT